MYLHILTAMCTIEVKGVVAKTTWYQYDAGRGLVEYLRRSPPSLLVESSSKILLSKYLLQYTVLGRTLGWLVGHHSEWFQQVN